MSDDVYGYLEAYERATMAVLAPPVNPILLGPPPDGILSAMLALHRAQLLDNPFALENIHA